MVSRAWLWVVVVALAGCGGAAKAPTTVADLKTMAAKVHMGMSEAEVTKLIGAPSRRAQDKKTLLSYDAGADSVLCVLLADDKVNRIWVQDGGAFIQYQ